ncbi:hypothetical protein KFL_010520020 [Klebsormidium nitens]|uniref:Receptor-like PK ALE2 N-terminal domain-containing protein n=1 Tax=Klebsormidium nitens TaxID=105231 RepID=A0A1Y1ITB1_KLENI|nr:hypothetical protein KFL_010520020 [Klebsormidium nitens]|eukprot:GAQ92561.1 hypothetical protein KFL_010520020 [Klebsormidium nitens]
MQAPVIPAPTVTLPATLQATPAPANPLPTQPPAIAAPTNVAIPVPTQPLSTAAASTSPPTKTSTPAAPLLSAPTPAATLVTTPGIPTLAPTVAPIVASTVAPRSATATPPPTPAGTLAPPTTPFGTPISTTPLVAQAQSLAPTLATVPPGISGLLNTSAPVNTSLPLSSSPLGVNLSNSPLLTPFQNLSQLNGTFALAAPPLTFPSPPPSGKNCPNACPLGTALRPADLTCDCVLPTIVELAFRRFAQQFLPNVPEFVLEVADGLNLTAAQVSVQGFCSVLHSGRRLLQSQVHDLIVTTWLLPIASPADPAPMQLSNNQTAAITELFVSKQMRLNQTLFGDYSVIQILPPAPVAAATMGTGSGVPIVAPKVGAVSGSPSLGTPPNASPSSSSSDSGSLSVGVVAGIVAGAIFGIGGLLFFVSFASVVRRRRLQQSANRTGGWSKDEGSPDAPVRGAERAPALGAGLAAAEGLDSWGSPAFAPLRGPTIPPTSAASNAVTHVPPAGFLPVNSLGPPSVGSTSWQDPPARIGSYGATTATRPGQFPVSTVDSTGLAPGLNYSSELEYYSPEQPGSKGHNLKWARKR